MELSSAETERLSKIRAQFERAQLQLVAAQQAVDMTRLQYRVAELEILAAHELSPSLYRIEPVETGFGVRQTERTDATT